MKLEIAAFSLYLPGRPKPEDPDLAEQGEVYLRHYELIAEMRPMKKSVRYTKTGLVFGFPENQILVAVIPGLKNAEDFTRAK